MVTSTRWRSRIVGHGEEAPDQLIANPRNWRIHTQGQQDALAALLDQVGWVQDVVVNRRTGYVVDGHLRVVLAISRAEATVPVVFVDLSPEEEALVLAALDPLSAMAVADEDALRALLADVSVHSDALMTMLAAIAPPVPTPGLTDPDNVPEIAEVTTTAGELYALGAHRLLIGDATSEADVARLLDGERPRLLVSDPPYGVRYDPTWRDAVAPQGKLRRGAVPNDDRADWRAAWVLTPADVAYVWHGGLHAGEVADSLAAVGFVLRAQIIWAKQSLVLGRGDYHWQHEPCWYAVRTGATAEWAGDRKQTTLWEIQNANLHSGGAKDDADTDHGTQKPVECMERPLRNHAGDVYDPFVGSGTTLIAAERAGRRCFAMEIEPRYAQIAIERWQHYTGRTAERIG